MTLSWTDIKTNAIRFAADFADARHERAEAQTFWNQFFAIFGIERRRVAVYESKVAKLNKNPGFMDLFWPGVLLVEHKSVGEKLELAHDQATDYFLKLKDGEHPRYIVVCDFQNFWLKDLEASEGDTEKRFALKDLHKHVALFGFLRGQQAPRVRADDPVNEKAVKKLSRLHQALRADGYTGHALQQLMVRLLFCLFADRTGLFEPAGEFTDLVESGTKSDGSDLGPVLMQLFDQLDTEFAGRQKSMPGWFAHYPYVNGRLFEEKTRIPSFNAAMRELLLDCCHTDWSRISPAIFGSMFQHIIDGQGADAQHDLRRELGAHYTSEDNILKLIGPLFLDDLRAEFSRVKSSEKKLFEFQKKLRRLRFLDPACGCGNFLVITYRELRLLELNVLRAAQGFGWRTADPFKAVMVNVDQFSGIEIEEFPARVAQVAMWLVDHQMNMLCGELFEQWLPRLPLTRSANIRIGNALNLDWADLCPPEQLSFILGNPPFIGKQNQTPAQKADMERVLAGTDIKGGGVLDYVAAWYIKAAQYLVGAGAAKANDRKQAFTQAVFSSAKTIDFLDEPVAAESAGSAASGKQGKRAALAAANDIFELAEQQNRAARESIGVAFVSTNSICQGEQVGLLWGWMLKEGLRIEFAHRTFKWSNEASGQAAVHCVIVGFGLAARVGQLANHRLFDYAEVDGPPMEGKAARINPYLVDAADVVLPTRSLPLCNVPPTKYGSKPVDDGNLILTDEQYSALFKTSPQAKPFVREMVSNDEFLHGKKRWCIWLKDQSASEWSKIPEITRRVKEVAVFRAKSTKAQTRELAELPSLFAEIRQPETRYIVIPLHSSENRRFVPLGYCEPEVILHNSCSALPEATLYHFGVLSSTMHNAWIRYTCGRLESRYRYSAGIVYNNFPWPNLESNRSIAQAGQALEAIETGAKAVLDARAAHPGSSLAVLYDRLLMPADLLQAHRLLDKAVDAAYGIKASDKIQTDAQRVAFLFALYEKLAQSVTVQVVAPEAVDAAVEGSVDSDALAS